MDKITSERYIREFLNQFSELDWPLIIQLLSIYGLEKLKEVIQIKGINVDQLQNYVNKNISIKISNNINPFLDEINDLKNQVSSLDLKIRNMHQSPLLYSDIEPHYSKNPKIDEKVKESHADDINQENNFTPNNINLDSNIPDKNRINIEEKKLINKTQEHRFIKEKEENFDKIRKRIEHTLPLTPVRQSQIKKYIYPKWWNNLNPEIDIYKSERKHRKGINQKEIEDTRNKSDQRNLKWEKENENNNNIKNVGRAPIVMEYNIKEFTNEHIFDKPKPIVLEAKRNLKGTQKNSEKEVNPKANPQRKIKKNKKREFSGRIQKPKYLLNVKSFRLNQILKHKTNRKHKKNFRIHIKTVEFHIMIILLKKEIILRKIKEKMKCQFLINQKLIKV